jgi:hypothetical protein
MILGLSGVALCGCGAASSGNGASSGPSSSGAISSSSTDTSTVTTNAGGQTIYRYNMPASGKPTTCTVSLQGHDAELTFDSQALDVTPACNSWIQSSAAGGELWEDGPPTNPNPSGPFAQVCSLSDNGRATATINDTGGDAYGQQIRQRPPLRPRSVGRRATSSDIRASQSGE